MTCVTFQMIYDFKKLFCPLKDRNLILVVLNNDLGFGSDCSLFLRLWNKSFYRVCADGGANKIFHLNKELIPDAVCGDFDSIDDSVKTYFTRKQVNILYDKDQDTTDLDKTLNHIKSKFSNCMNLNICIFGAFGGRFDHEMAHINRCFVYESVFKSIFLLSHQTATVLLNTGEHLIILDKNQANEKIGLIPIGEPSIITTKGLKWDVTDCKTKFGGNISTSNEIKKDCEVVKIKTSSSILWCAHLNNKASL